MRASPRTDDSSTPEDRGGFALFAKPVRRLIAEKGFEEESEPQTAAIPKILEGRNVLLIAPTGTGKTEAAFLPFLHQMLSMPRTPGIKLVYVTPLRALNRDLLDRLLWWCRKLDFRVSVRHGDTDVRERRSQALSPPDILITTPETLQIILNGRLLRGHLKALKWMIVDEVHELAESKRGSQLSLTLEKLRWTAGPFQVVGLSATVGSPEKIGAFLVGSDRECDVIYVPVARTMKLDLIFPEPTREDYRLAGKLYTYPEVAARLAAMRNLIQSYGSTLLFTNTRPTAEVLASRFRIWDMEFPVSVHHGSLSAPSRVRAETGIKTGSLSGVICTSSLELGIDVGRIELCIQYGSPRQVTRLVQRVGRSGHRIGGTARGVIVCMDSDDALESLVIAQLALEEKLEPASIPPQPLDVLTHELAGLLIVQRHWRTSDAHELVIKSTPYSQLGRQELVDVLRYMDSLVSRLAWLSSDQESFARPSRNDRLFKYYYEHLSMIPVTKQYLVVNDKEGLPVGVLDEAFVTEHGDPGVKFVLGGSAWKTIQVFKDRVYVVPDDDPRGAIPSWVGEQIPVPLDVAQRVGSLRGRVEQAHRRGASSRDIAKELSEELPGNEGFIRKAIRDTFDHAAQGHPVPTDLMVVVEGWGENVVIHAHFGTLVNRTLARYLALSLTEERAETVGLYVDPYRIFLRGTHASPQEVADLLTRSTREEVERRVHESVEESRFLRWRLVQVARRMGAVARDAEMSGSMVTQLLKSLTDTPAFTEALKEVTTKDLDMEGTLAVLARIRGGEIGVQYSAKYEGPSPLSGVGLRWAESREEYVSPKRLELLSLASARARLLTEVRWFACLDCGKYIEERAVYTLPEEVRCPLCESTRITMTEGERRIIVRLIRRGKQTKLGRGDRTRYRNLAMTADIVARKGKLGATVLAGRGIRLEKAEEILTGNDQLSNRVVKMIMKAEREGMLRRF